MLWVVALVKYCNSLPSGHQGPVWWSERPNPTLGSWKHFPAPFDYQRMPHFNGFCQRMVAFFPHAFGKCSQKLRQETILFCRSKFWDTPNIAQDRWFAVKGCLQLACSTSAHLIRSHRPFLGNPSFSKWTDSFSQRIGSSVMPSQQADYFFLPGTMDFQFAPFPLTFDLGQRSFNQIFSPRCPNWSGCSVCSLRYP